MMGYPDHCIIESVDSIYVYNTPTYYISLHNYGKRSVCVLLPYSSGECDGTVTLTKVPRSSMHSAIQASHVNRNEELVNQRT